MLPGIKRRAERPAAKQKEKEVVDA